MQSVYAERGGRVVQSVCADRKGSCSLCVLTGRVVQSVWIQGEAIILLSS